MARLDGKMGSDLWDPEFLFSLWGVTCRKALLVSIVIIDCGNRTGRECDILVTLPPGRKLRHYQ
jgi:hypothetical protein